MKVDDFFKEWTGQRPNLCTAVHDAGIEAMAFADAYHKQQVELLATLDVSKCEGLQGEATLIDFFSWLKLKGYLRSNVYAKDIIDLYKSINGC